jgi:RNA polymerase sigma factor (sigma-70 family)
MPNDSAAEHSLTPTRPSLLFRLQDWMDTASWTEFYRVYEKFVFGFALRSGLPRADAEEVTQDVFKRVAQTIHEFESNPARGSFRGWLMNLTRWRIMDRFRERQRLGRLQGGPSARVDDDRTATIERIADPAGPTASGADPTAEESEWQSHVLDAALTRLARRVPAKHFQLFDLMARQQWPVLRVSRELGMNPATVYVVRHRLMKQLKGEVEKLRAQLG